MSRVLFLLFFGLMAMSSCGQKPTTDTATTKTATTVPTNTTAKVPPKTVDIPPAGTIKSPAGAPLGSIYNPIMNGLEKILGPARRPTQPVAQKKPEPPQNAAGVWHYICPDGHAGGAGAAQPCKTCSNTLIHNQAYHNK